MHQKSCKNCHESFGITHISNKGGVSLADGNGFGAIVTRKYFETIDESTVAFCTPILSALGDEACCKVLMAVLSMSDISYYELIEKLAMDEPTLQKALDLLLERKILEAEKSKHKVRSEEHTSELQSR